MVYDLPILSEIPTTTIYSDCFSHKNMGKLTSATCVIEIFFLNFRDCSNKNMCMDRWVGTAEWNYR